MAVDAFHGVDFVRNKHYLVRLQVVISRLYEQDERHVVSPIC